METSERLTSSYKKIVTLFAMKEGGTMCRSYRPLSHVAMRLRYDSKHHDKRLWKD